MSEKEKVEGYVEHIIFRNEENGYTVLNLSMEGARADMRRHASDDRRRAS